jgi:phosphate transport system substrate-binding protein
MAKKYLVLLVAVLIFAGCKDEIKYGQGFTDDPKQGTIYISVDESFKPVIEQEIKVYESSYPGTHIIASYKPEVECFKDLMKDSTRMVIVAKGLTPVETKYYDDRIYFRPQFAEVAYDAVAVIVNMESKDSVFTFEGLKKLVSGKKDGIIVMDGKNATSTVRFLQDSLLGGGAFGKNVLAVNGSKAVIEAIKQNKNAIGFVGSSWVGNESEPSQREDLKKIRLALVECTKCTEKDLFAKPSQSTITFGQYPLIRPLFYILKENWTGLGSGFMNFMSLERGQLIFRRSGLAPAKMSFLKRTSKIQE